MTCIHCGRPIELIDGGGKSKYIHRHSDDKRISCYGIYQPENAAPATEGLTA